MTKESTAKIVMNYLCDKIINNCIYKTFYCNHV